MKVGLIVEAALDLSHRLREQALFFGAEAITVRIPSRAWAEFLDALIASHLWRPMGTSALAVHSHRVVSLGFVTFEVVG